MNSNLLYRAHKLCFLYIILGIQEDSEGLLIQVRLWHYMTGGFLDTFEAEVGLGKCSNGAGNHTSSAVTTLSVSSNSSVIAVAIESLYGCCS